MQQIVQVIGGAGTGKTYYLLGVMEQVIQTGISPMQLGFVTFTKAARREAAERAAEKFGYSVDDLEQAGYFKTLHAVCYMLLHTKADSMITDNKESREWIAEALGERVESLDNLSGSEPFQGRSDSEIALGLWHCARNRLEPFARTWERAEYTDERTPSLIYCKKIIEQYERYKNLDGRVDFTDILGQFAGFKFRFDGPEVCEPQGEPPSVPVWFLDECQDNSALTDAVARRLTSKAKWIYLVADPFQAIYGWAGADSKHFLSWPVTPGKKKILNQTRRCPAPIITLGENILRECSDYWDRGILPAPHAGSVERINYGERWVDDLSPSDSWLLIARTNFQAASIAKKLDAEGIPWRNAGKGNNKWNAPIKHKTILAMKALNEGHAISETEWRLILKGIKNQKGKEYFARGTKREWEQKSVSDPQLLNNLEGLKDWGATDDFIAMIKLNYWHKFINGSKDYLQAAKRWGYDAVDDPQIRVGTIHSVKGSEADNVLLLTTTSHQIHKGQEETAGANEERRVEYVAVTRARKKLFICEDKKAKFAMLRDIV